MGSLYTTPYTYIYEFPGWNPEGEFPNFVWDAGKIHGEVLKLQIGYVNLVAMLGQLGVADRDEISRSMIALEAYHSSMIEHSALNQTIIHQALTIYQDIAQASTQPLSSRADVANLVKLALGSDGLMLSDHDAEQGVAAIAVDAVHHYKDPVTHERLHSWHGKLFPSGFAEMEEAGQYRQDLMGRMQVASGHADPDHRKVSYVAPKAEDVQHEMDRLLAWINNPPASISPYIMAGITHLMFTAIHPYADGNGRLDRSLTDMMLARADGTDHRYYSVSAEIDRVKSSGYYQQLQSAVRRLPGFVGTKPEIDITDWLEWFLGCVQGAMKHSQVLVRKIIVKQELYARHGSSPLTPQQDRILDMLIMGGGETLPQGTKLTADKCGKICAVPSTTAGKMLDVLVAEGILVCGNPEAKKPQFVLAPQYLRLLHQ